LFGQFLDLIGHNREPLAGFAGAGSFNRGIQGQQVGLLRNRGNDLDDLANLGRGISQFAHDVAGLFRHLDRTGRYFGRFMRVLGDLLDAGAHFFAARRHGLQVFVDLFGTP
jgi:hypothetical protein